MVISTKKQKLPTENIEKILPGSAIFAQIILHILRSPYYSIFHVHSFGSRRYLRAEIALWDYFLLHLRQRRTSSYPGSQAAERVRCERESGGLNARSSSITISSRRERKADAGGAAAAFDGTRFSSRARVSLLCQRYYIHPNCHYHF
jgi:hypothetical protein